MIVRSSSGIPFTYGLKIKHAPQKVIVFQQRLLTLSKVVEILPTP